MDEISFKTHIRRQRRQSHDATQNPEIHTTNRDFGGDAGAEFDLCFETDHVFHRDFLTVHLP